jgi:hypothetical protein
MGRYDDMTLDELVEEGKKRELSGVHSMSKAELVEALNTDGGADASSADSSGGSSGGGGPVQQTDNTKYSQEITSPDEHEERPGRSLVTRNHDVIKQWAEARNATPATVPGTEHGDHLGVLRFDFPGYGGKDLEHVSWDEWFKTFDERNLNFIYQEHKSDGADSNFFRLDNPDREDA